MGILESLKLSRKRSVEEGTLLDDLISQPVLWFLVTVFIATSGALLGYSIPKIYDQARNNNNNSSGPAKYDDDPNFLSLLWQAILQLLASYCSLVPVLRERRKKVRNNKMDRVTDIKRRTRNKITQDVVFFGSVIISIITAIMAPILYARLWGSSSKAAPGTASNVLNFISTIFSTIAASQLAGRIENREFS